MIGASAFVGVGAVAGLVIGLAGSGNAEPSSPAPVTVQSTQTLPVVTLPAVTVPAPMATVTTADPATSTVTAEAPAPTVAAVTTPEASNPTPPEPQSPQPTNLGPIAQPLVTAGAPPIGVPIPPFGPQPPANG